MAFAIGIPLALQFVSTISAEAGYVSALNLGSRESLATVALVGGTTSESYRQMQNRAMQAVASDTSGQLTVIAEYGALSSFTVLSRNAGEFPLGGLPPLTAAFYPALQQKAQITSGNWPTPIGTGDAAQATVSQAAADVYGWKVGDRICLTSTDDTPSRPAPACLRITGIWRPAIAGDPFWLSAPQSNSITFASDGFWLFAQRAQYGHVTTNRVYRPDPARLTVEQASQLEAGIKRLRSSLRYGGDDLFTTLDRTIAGFLERSAVNRFPIQLVGAELIVVVLFGLAFLSQSFLGTQEVQSSLWRIRGWSRLDIARFLSMQFLLLSVPALVLGITAALVATGIEASRYGLDWRLLATDIASALGHSIPLIALATAAICLALTVRFSWRTVSQIRRSARTPVNVAWWRARNLDIALTVLALPLLAEAALRSQAVVRSIQEGPDLAGLLLPILALTFLAIAALRLIPVMVHPIRPLARGVAGRLTWWRLSRQPAEHAGAAVLLSLTLGVGLFASIYDATATSNATDRAAYATGADLRITFTPGTGATGIRNELAHIDGVTAVTGVLRQRIQIASSSETVTALALDPVTFAKASWSRPGLTSPSLGTALAQMSGTPGIRELPGQPSELRMWARGLDQPLSIEAVIRDQMGQTCRCSSGSLKFSDWRQIHTQITFPSTPRYPLTLEKIRIHRTASGRPGTVYIGALQSVSSSGIESIDTFATVTGWLARDESGLVIAPGIVGPQGNSSASTEIPLPALGDVNLFPPFRSGGLPFLMAAPTISRLALKPGDSVALAVDSRQIVGRLIGPIDYVPTVYPGSEDFIVLPLDRALSAFAATSDRPQTPNEIWLAMTPQGERAAPSQGASAVVDFVVNRQHEQDVASNDPVLIQLRANLANGSAAALVLAFLGFAVHFLIAARRRLVEHAILEANGLEPNDVRRGLAIEQIVIVVFALLVGMSLAGVGVSVLLPALQFGTSPTAFIPPTVVRIDWPPLMVIGALAAGITALLAWLTRRLGTSMDVVEELRKLG